MLAGMFARPATTSAPAGTWDFGAGATAAGLTISAQGGTGTGGVSGSRLVLAPQQNVSNSVAALAAGSYTHASLIFTTTARSGESPAYPALSIGSGAIRNLGGDSSSWWFTCLTDAYVAAIGGDQRILLCRADGASGLVIVYQSGVIGGVYDAERVLELSVSGGTVSVVLDGATIYSTTGAVYGAGDVLVAQGAYSAGFGGSMAVRKLVCA